MFVITPSWSVGRSIRALTTTKALDLHKIRETLQLPEVPWWPKQVHATEVAVLEQVSGVQEADAVMTKEAGRVAAIRTADCLPLLLCDKQETVVAAVHAGWRSLLEGIIEKTVASLGVPAAQLCVWLGPCIGPKAYEVGPEFKEAFMRKDLFAAEAFEAIAGRETFWANLPLLAKQRLLRCGVRQEHIVASGYCTYSEPSLFHSFRRDKAAAGRMATLIWRTMPSL